VPAHYDKRAPAKPKATATVKQPIERMRNTAGLTSRQMERVNHLLESGQAVVIKEGSKYTLKVKPQGHVRYTTVGTFTTAGDVVREVAVRFKVTSRGKEERTYTDVGAKIGGARKDIAASQGKFREAPSLKALDDLEKQDPDAARRQVTRETIWPRPTLNAYREQGRPDDWCLYALTVYSLIQAKPAGHRPDDRRVYTEAVLSAREAVESSTDLRSLYDNLAGWKQDAETAIEAARWKRYQQKSEQDQRIERALSYSGGPKETTATDYQFKRGAFTAILGEKFAKWLMLGKRYGKGEPFSSMKYTLAGIEQGR